MLLSNSYFFLYLQSVSKSGGGGLREPENDSDVLIECRDVYKSFGDKHILKGVSFKVMLFMFC